MISIIRTSIIVGLRINKIQLKVLFASLTTIAKYTNSEEGSVLPSQDLRGRRWVGYLVDEMANVISSQYHKTPNACAVLNPLLGYLCRLRQLNANFLDVNFLPTGRFLTQVITHLADPLEWAKIEETTDTHTLWPL
ncbi:uncharacterized protein MELLADRAFT_101217 [Melampsora larici-populina 98AG31]|uniref:Uncharacterized protein n=1 Tax=Melampsora larici-populina (strain 98AG31 / pathotype 3-4-7) TaxID=747676 RepID=F4R409_MELLP|nr:uncharacterized protein MELLADRAFT_101217 [Melampsora larici-populina 98AG31]EGG12717.1 hypothetical protein MELLADRAFT_101217 [Melampsora larici-populina 98AG31]